MKLLIVESPSKARTVEKYLGKDFRVLASVGHIRDLPKSNRAAIDVPGGFIPHYEVVKGKEKVISEIKTLAKKADEILLATDPDREGEAIAWHVAQACGLSDGERKSNHTNVKRIVFHEITKEAVEEALEHPREIDTNLREAQEARRVLDRLVGYDLSGLIWKKVRYGLSAGRVQSPALRIIMEREREIRAFKPVTFWKIWAILNDLKFECSVEPQDKKEVERIIALGKSGVWKVTDIKEMKIARAPRAPFITSTLQQTASSRLGLAPSRTMSLAQRLYEAGHITYMRTDSTNLGEGARKEIEGLVKKKYGENYFESHVFAKKSKNAQEAHEAIRPTHANMEKAGANEAEQKLYSLIWQRTVASQMKSAEVMRTKVVANIPSEERPGGIPLGLSSGNLPDFWLNGSRILFDGWLKADPRSASEDIVLPKLQVNDSLKLINIDSEEKQTEPLARYSEAGLIKELEKRGIGRPSTYASIIKTLEDRDYVNKLNKALYPTDTGDVVSTFLEAHFPTYISDSFTAEMEDELDDIATGQRSYKKTLADFYTPFEKVVKAKEKVEKITNLGPSDLKCPICGGPMIIKLGKSGKFLSCEKFPECQGARTIEGKELKGPKDTGELCPKCGKGNLVTREGKFGMFTACSRFPKCKFIKKDEEQEKANSTGVKCPVCKNGLLTERRGRFGVFYSCSNYPDCKYAIKAKPTGEICKICGSLMMEGTKTIPERCSDKKCPNHNPHKIKET